MSLPIVTLASSPTSANSKNFREPSFSSYLDGAEETFVLKLRGKTTQALDSSISIPQDHVFLPKTGIEDAEIDVFGAERYFNEGLNHIPHLATKILPSHQMKTDDRTEIFALEKQHQITVSSIHSESSWNSRSALLAGLSRKQQTRRTNKKSYLASTGCSCSCNSKNSVTVNVFNNESWFSKSTNSRNRKSRQRDKNSDHLVSNVHLDFNCIKFDELKARRNSDGNFSFPVFNPRNGHQAANVQANDTTRQKSVEIFGSKYLGSGKNCWGLEKKLNLLTWDAIAPGAAKIRSVSCEIGKDSDGDSSSDLFELESFSKSSIQAPDNIFSGCVTPIACHAPSEASIDWTVITPDADYDVLSDSDELRSVAMITPQPQEVGQDLKNVRFKDMSKQRSRILSGCKSQKAVMVVEDAVSDGRRHRSESLTPMTRFHYKNNMLYAFVKFYFVRSIICK